MAFDAGLDSSLFHDVGAVDKLILQMEEHFDLVLIAEQMERSLVLMADMLCWPMDEVITLHPTNATTSTLSKEQRLKLRALNAADVAIYEHFAKTLRVRVRSFGEQRMANRLKLLRVRSRLMKEQCSGNATTNVKTDAPQMCHLMVMPEEQLTELIRKEQLQRFNNEKNSTTQTPVK
jgi:Galactose-3-O-sulfotransferase